MSVAMTDWISRHRINVDDYYRMAEVGILPPDARVELIEGEIIDMASIGPPHAGTVTHLIRLLADAVGDQTHLVVQSPVRLSDISEPVPDFALVKPRADFYKKAHPGSDDIFLIIEVSQTSLRYDSQIKAPLYAQHGIAEYWVVDLAGRRIGFFRSPSEGKYSEAVWTAAPGIVSLVRLPDIKIDLNHILED